MTFVPLHTEIRDGLGSEFYYDICRGDETLDFVSDALEAEFYVHFINTECQGIWNNDTKKRAVEAWQTHGVIRVYFINELKRAEDGGYIPCIAQEGRTGFWPTDWNWGEDLGFAREIADEMNEKLGWNKKIASIVQLRSMRVVA
jgi:hypothetical protein